MPAGLKRSRALWDNASRPHTSRLEQAMAYLRAMLYELQPVRYSQMQLQLLQWKAPARQALRFLKTCLTTYGPQFLKWMWQILSQLTLRQWMYGAFALIYYYSLKWIHATLEAGPLVLISTALVLIWTVGLSDNTEDNDGLSAYSVFNRGFQKLMGSVNEHDLLMQHVGGGGLNFMMGMGNANNPPNNHHHHDDDDENWRPRNRRQNNLAPRPDAREPPEQPQAQPPPNDNAPRARRSGKKARRRNQEQRQEVRRQRQAAAERALVEGGADEAAALQALLEEQIAENQARHVDEQEVAVDHREEGVEQ